MHIRRYFLFILAEKEIRKSLKELTFRIRLRKMRHPHSNDEKKKLEIFFPVKLKLMERRRQFNFFCIFIQFQLKRQQCEGIIIILYPLCR